MDTIGGFLNGLNDALQGPGRPSALDAAIAAMKAGAIASIAGTIDDGATVLIKQPWRFERILPGVDVKTTGGRIASLARCREAIAGERERGRAGHWTYDNNRLLALLQAEEALTRMLSPEAA